MGIKIKLPIELARPKIKPGKDLANLNNKLGLTGVNRLKAGDKNPIFENDILDVISFGGRLIKENNIVTTTSIDDDLVDMEVVERILASDGDIEGMPVFFEFDTEEEFGNEIPLNFPNREDENGDAYTWIEWLNLKPTSYPKNINSKWYVHSKNMHTGEQLPASVWYNSGLNYISLQNYRALQI